MRTAVNSASRTVCLFIPGTQLRQIFDRQEYRHYPGRMSYIDPLLQPSYQVERLCSALFAAPEFDPAQRQLFIDGLAHSLLACILGIRSRRPSIRKSQLDRGLSDAELERCIEYADSMMEQRMDLNAWAEKVLREALEKIGVKAERSVTMISFAQDERETSVTAVLQHSDGSLERFDCPYMIDAEGTHSTARTTLGLQFQGKSLAEDYALGDLYIDGDLVETDLISFPRSTASWACSRWGSAASG